MAFDRKAHSREYESRPHTKAIRLARDAKKRAAKAGLPFALTVEWIEERILDGCPLSGMQFDLSPGMVNPFSPSVDKVKNHLGYTQDNCRVIIYGLNALKGTGTDADLLNISKVVIDYNLTFE